MMNRRHPRIPKRIRTNVRFLPTDMTVLSFTGNLSESGVFVTSNRSVAVGNTVLLELQGMSTHYLEAEVRWVRGVDQRLRSVVQAGFGASFLAPQHLVSQIAGNLTEMNATTTPLPEKYALTFANKEQFLEEVNASLKHGVAFLPTDAEDTRDTVPITIKPPLMGDVELQFMARPIKYMPAKGAGDSASKSGMVVEFVDRNALNVSLGLYANYLAR